MPIFKEQEGGPIRAPIKDKSGKLFRWAEGVWEAKIGKNGYKECIECLKRGLSTDELDAHYLANEFVENDKPIFALQSALLSLKANTSPCEPVREWMKNGIVEWFQSKGDTMLDDALGLRIIPRKGKKPGGPSAKTQLATWRSHEEVRNIIAATIANNPGWTITRILEETERRSSQGIESVKKIYGKDKKLIKLKATMFWFGNITAIP